ALHGLAAARNVTPAALAIAWVRAQGPHIIPTLGARTRRQLDDALVALTITLSPAELAAIEAAVPAAAIVGSRYAAAQMAHLDSER
ncbi:MAG: aldo/keto reductase, partial [Proteobacteria bacterium]|nr:aldo/keto reductase [Pseudomonadota bacterium]